MKDCLKITQKFYHFVELNKSDITFLHDRKPSIHSKAFLKNIIALALFIMLLLITFNDFEAKMGILCSAESTF